MKNQNRNQYLKDLRKKRKLEGKCIKCGKENLNKKAALCDSCNKKGAENIKKWREKAGDGCCSKCCKPKDDSNKMCQVCLKKQRTRWEKKKTNGVCKNCTNTILEGRSLLFCKNCLEKNRQITSQDKLSNRFHSMKTRAKINDIKFNLEKQEFINWWKSQPEKCYYCGVSQEFLTNLNRKKSSMTIDRKNNQKGYEVSNICLSCARCNNMKSNFFTEEEWKQIAKLYITPRLEQFHCES